MAMSGTHTLTQYKYEYFSETIKGHTAAHFDLCPRFAVVAVVVVALVTAIWLG
jgi:hypothetical protein